MTALALSVCEKQRGWCAGTSTIGLPFETLPLLTLMARVWVLRPIFSHSGCTLACPMAALCTVWRPFDTCTLLLALVQWCGSPVFPVSPRCWMRCIAGMQRAATGEHRLVLTAAQDSALYRWARATAPRVRVCGPGKAPALPLKARQLPPRCCVPTRWSPHPWRDRKP